MIKNLIGKKLSSAIESSKYGTTRVGRTAGTFLDAEKREAENQRKVNIITEEMRHSYFRRRVIAASLAVNLISWLALLLLPDMLKGLVFVASLIFSKGGFLLVLPAFAATLLGVYALFRTWFPDIENRVNSDSGVMNSFQRQSDSSRLWRVSVASCGIAAVNSIFLVVAYMSVTQSW